MSEEPNAAKNLVSRDCDPLYMNRMFRKSLLTQAECSKRLGVARSTLQDWIDPESDTQWPYAAQFALERLTERKDK